MLNTEQILSILGEDRVFEITNTLSDKKMNQETIIRVLDYLALNKVAFPYIDNRKLGQKLCSNLNSNIVFNDLKNSILSMFKYKFYGYATGSKIVVNTKPFKFIFPKKQFNTMTDALIRHELDHIATTNVKILDKENFRHFLMNEAEQYQQLFNIQLDKDILTKDIEEAVHTRFYTPQRLNIPQPATAKIVSSGIDGRCDYFTARKKVGHTPLNEGITAWKMKKLDKIAGQGGFFCQSGYMLEEAVAQEFIDNIGEETLIKLQSEGDFFEITNLYKQKTGKSGKWLLAFFNKLSQNKPKSITAKMIKQLKFSINPNIDKDMQSLYGENNTPLSNE